MRVLVSLTNKHGQSKKCPDANLLEIDSKTESITPIRLEHWLLPTPLAGVAPLVFWRDTVVFFTDGCAVGQLDQNYQLKRAWYIPVEQAHTTVCVNDKLYIAANVRDCVIESEPFDERHTVFWKDNPGRKDTIHLNSIAHHQGDFYISAFGPRKDFWHSSREGYIQNITTGDKVVTGLQQPHSLLSHGDELYYCVSAASEVRRLGDPDDCLVVDERSYVRGLAITDEMLVVGTSKGRKKSKSTGQDLLTNFTDPGLPTGHCALHFYRRGIHLQDAQLEKTVLLDDYGPEIFDILPVDGWAAEKKSFSIKQFFKSLLGR